MQKIHKKKTKKDEKKKIINNKGKEGLEKYNKKEMTKWKEKTEKKDVKGTLNAKTKEKTRINIVIQFHLYFFMRLDGKAKNSKTIQEN